MDQAYSEFCNPLDDLSVNNATHNFNTQLFRGSTFPAKNLVSKFTNGVMIQSIRIAWGSP